MPSTKKITRNNGKDFLVYQTGSGGTVEILDIAVMSERQKGIGREMVEELKNRVDTHLIFAITRPSNGVAIKFYLALGFKIVSRLKRFYVEGDAIMYGLWRK